MFVCGWLVLGKTFGYQYMYSLFYPMGSFILGVEAGQLRYLNFVFVAVFSTFFLVTALMYTGLVIINL